MNREREKKKLSQKLSLTPKIKREKIMSLDPCVSSNQVFRQKILRNQKEIKISSA